MCPSRLGPKKRLGRKDDRVSVSPVHLAVMLSGPEWSSAEAV